MIVNPPRSEAELSPRLQSISAHAAEKNEDPDDRPPWIPAWMVRRILLLSALLLFAGVMRTGLWMIIHHPEWSTTQGELAQMYRNMAHQSEGYAIACRAIIKTGKPDNIPGVGLVSDPVLAQTLANQYETQAASYRAQAHVQESLNQGYSIR